MPSAVQVAAIVARLLPAMVAAACCAKASPGAGYLATRKSQVTRDGAMTRDWRALTLEYA